MVPEDRHRARRGRKDPQIPSAVDASSGSIDWTPPLQAVACSGSVQKCTCRVGAVGRRTRDPGDVRAAGLVGRQVDVAPVGRPRRSGSASVIAAPEMPGFAERAGRRSEPSRGRGKRKHRRDGDRSSNTGGGGVTSEGWYGRRRGRADTGPPSSGTRRRKHVRPHSQLSRSLTATLPANNRQVGCSAPAASGSFHRRPGHRRDRSRPRGLGASRAPGRGAPSNLEYSRDGLLGKHSADTPKPVD